MVAEVMWALDKDYCPRQCTNALVNYKVFDIEVDFRLVEILIAAKFMANFNVTFTDNSTYFIVMSRFIFVVNSIHVTSLKLTAF